MLEGVRETRRRQPRNVRQLFQARRFEFWVSRKGLLANGVSGATDSAVHHGVHLDTKVATNVPQIANQFLQAALEVESFGTRRRTRDETYDRSPQLCTVGAEWANTRRCFELELFGHRRDERRIDLDDGESGFTEHARRAMEFAELHDHHL